MKPGVTPVGESSEDAADAMAPPLIVICYMHKVQEK